MAGEGEEHTSSKRSLPYRGGAITLLLVILLATPPSEILEQAGAYADTRGDIRSTSATPIRVNDALAADPNSTIPRDLGPWHGVDDHSWPDLLQERLAYDSLLVRHYSRPGIFQSIELMVISARHASAFHNPTVCFRAQGNDVLVMDDTNISFDGFDHAVGRMVVDSEASASRVVYNLYLVEEKFAAPSRTTWIRLNAYGANLTTEPELEPYLLDLLNRIAPHAFTGRSGARTSIGAIADAGIGWAAGAVALSVAPVAVELLMRRRT